MENIICLCTSVAENVQNFKSNTVTVIELHVFMERKNEKKMANLCLPMLYGIFIQLFARSYYFTCFPLWCH